MDHRGVQARQWVEPEALPEAAQGSGHVGGVLQALLGKETLIPVLHNVTFDDVRQYSGILPDLAGFTTASDSVEAIASKVAPAVLVDDNPNSLPA